MVTVSWSNCRLPSVATVGGGLQGVASHAILSRLAFGACSRQVKQVHAAPEVSKRCAEAVKAVVKLMARFCFGGDGFLTLGSLSAHLIAMSVSLRWMRRTRRSAS